MAKCEKREIPQPKPPVEYVLTMDLGEATALRALISYGSWPSQHAEEIAKISYALCVAGVVR